MLITYRVPLSNAFSDGWGVGFMGLLAIRRLYSIHPSPHFYESRPTRYKHRNKCRFEVRSIVHATIVQYCTPKKVIIGVLFHTNVTSIQYAFGSIIENILDKICSFGYKRTNFAPTSAPPSTLYAFERCTISSTLKNRWISQTWRGLICQAFVFPTKIATEMAIQRWPAASKSSSMIALITWALSQSGRMTAWFLAPGLACIRLSIALPRA